MPSVKGFLKGIENTGAKYLQHLDANSAIQKTSSNLYKFNKNIKQVAEINAKGGGERISKQSKKIFNELKEVDPEFAKTVGDIKGKDLNHANEIQKYYELNKKGINTKAEQYKNMSSEIGAQSTTKDAFAKYREGMGHENDFKGNMKSGFDVAGTYFFGEGLKKGAIRTGTAAAGYMGANMAVRNLSGGSLTRNNNGESDIAGIPFV